MDPIENTKTEKIERDEGLAASFVRQTVSSAAVWTGLGLVLFASSKISNVWEAHKAKKNPPTES
jgi:hypothetical protein